MAVICRLLNVNIHKNILNIATKPSFLPKVFNVVSREPSAGVTFFHLPCEWTSYRYTYTFFNRVSAEQLWKGVLSVSPAGRKKGRGKRKGRRLSQDLNRGQVIGFGKKSMLWPGLTGPVIRGKEIVSQQELPPDEEREKRILEMRDKLSSIKREKIHPLERGWSGTKLPGRSLGPPDPVGDETFEGFDSRVLQFRSVLTMTKRGRMKKYSAFVVVGNKNGLAGFALAKSVNGMTAAVNAKNKAARVLRYIPRYKEHTVLHDFHSSFGALDVFVKKKSEGFGLVCHRAIKAICQMIGIKDLYAKVEGPTQNTQNLTKAFFIGLMKQKTPEQLAEEKGLHLIEMRKNRDMYPELIASPTRCRTEEELGIHESTNFYLHIHNNKVEKPPKKFEPFYSKFPSYLKKLKREERFRNNRDVRIQLMARYDGLKSFLTIREEEKKLQNVKNEVESNM